MEAFLDAYGLPAVTMLLLIKAIGVPVPIPGDALLLATFARAASGKVLLWQAVAALLVALTLGGFAQFLLARGAGRTLLGRFGARIGLSEARLDRTARAMQRAGPIGIGLAVLTPGVRTAAIPACGLVGVPVPTFLLGLTLGSAADLALHLVLGYTGGALLGPLLERVPVPLAAAALLLLLVIGLGVWWLIRRRQALTAAPATVLAEAVAGWEHATCPACLLLAGAAGRVVEEVEAPRPMAAG